MWDDRFAASNSAASVPGGFTPEGLPVGAQIVGHNKEDFSVLRMAQAFEQETGFDKKQPVITYITGTSSAKYGGARD